MPDNILLNVGVGGATLKTEEIGGVHYELIKLVFGDAGVATLVSSSNRLPVDFDTSTLATEATLASLLTKDFSTEATLGAILAKIIPSPATEATLAAILAKLIASPATETTLASVLAKLNASIAVTGAFFQATQPISAAALPLPAGAATAANQQTNALTDAQLRATPVPVSGLLASLSTATLANVAASSTSQTLLALNTNRKAAIIHNDSSVDLYIKYGSSAATTSFTYLIPANAVWEMPIVPYTGIITGVWTAAIGTGRVTELQI